MSDQVPVRKSAIYRAIDVLKSRCADDEALAKEHALNAIVGPDESKVAARDAAIQWFHRSVAYEEAVKIIEKALDDAARSGEPLVWEVV